MSVNAIFINSEMMFDFLAIGSVFIFYQLLRMVLFNINDRYEIIY